VRTETTVDAYDDEAWANELMKKTAKQASDECFI